MITFSPLQSEDTILITSIALATLGYLCYWYISHSPKFLEQIKEVSGKTPFTLKKTLLQRLTGILFLGIIPGFIVLKFLPFNLNSLGVSFNVDIKTFIWIISLSSLVISLSYFSRRSSEDLENYPQIRIPDWNFELIILNAVSWAGFLLAYEFLFRGILLFTLLNTLGVWAAIAINASLYALVHFPKGPRETFGAIPLGIVLCIATLSTGTIWTAFLVHLVMALSNDYFSIRSHQKYKFMR